MSRVSTHDALQSGWTRQHTLSVQEVCDRHCMAILMDRGILEDRCSEDLLLMPLRTETHILLTKRLDMGVKVVVALRETRLVCAVRNAYGKGSTYQLF